MDDILVACQQKSLIIQIEKLISKHFEIKNLGDVKQFLGIEIDPDNHGNYRISQTSYINKVLRDCGLENAKPSKIPLDVGFEKSYKGETLCDSDEYRKLIGKLLYISVNSRPDISASISMLAQHISHPTKECLVELNYLKGTSTMKLWLSKKQIQEEANVCGYADANWAENANDRKSNSCYVMKLYGGEVSWSCRKQNCVSLSSTEAEFVALGESCQELVWIMRLLRDMNIGFIQLNCMKKPELS